MAKNPHESMLDLYEVDSTKSPFYGKTCGICHKKCIKGDIVVGSIHYWSSVAMHTRCLKDMLDNSPLDKFEQLREKILTGGLFSD